MSSSEYIKKEIKDIVEDKAFKFPLNMAMGAAWLLGNLKGINLKVYDVAKTSSLADFYIIGSASNLPQAKAMANDILAYLKPHGLESLSKEGVNGPDWILIDLGDIIVHIFLEVARDVYDLDSLYGDSNRIEIPNSYYFSSEAAEDVKSEEKDYF